MQCVRNWEFQIKSSAIFQLVLSESAPEFGFNLFGEILYQAFAVLGASLTALLFFDYSNVVLKKQG